MLTTEQILQNKLKYLELLAKLNIDITDLSKYLESVNYFEQPATTQSFKAYPGGLCQYALDLCFELGNLCNAYFPGKYTEADIIKVALFKDLYRAEMYESYNRNVKNETTGNWESVQAYRTKDERPVFGDLGFSSYMTAKQFIDFNIEQIEAICHARPLDGYTNDLREILKKYPLVTLTRMADMAAMFLEDTSCQ